MKYPLKNSENRARLDIAYRNARKSLVAMLRVLQLVDDQNNASKVKQALLNIKIAYNRGSLGWDDEAKAMAKDKKKK
jgi:hypothetical protein